MPEAHDEQPISARALRFSRRLKGEALPDFADLQRKDRVDHLANARRDDVAPLVALLDARKAIDAELNGNRLGAIADMVGEERFDRICDVQIPSSIYELGAATLPQPGSLMRRGETLMECRERSEDTAHLVEIAAAICAETACEGIAA